MTAELWLEKRCAHGFIDCAEMICDHQSGEHPKDEHGTTWACWCPGGSRVRLDPDKVIPAPFKELITVKDVIDALTEQETDQ